MRFLLHAAACVAAAALALPVAVDSQAAASKAKPATPRAVLVRGAEAVKGLPAFGKNAFSALYGEYRLESDKTGAPGIRVWMTMEALYLAPAAWRPARLGRRGAFEFRGADPLTADGAGRLTLFDRPFILGGQGAEPKLWTVLIFVPAGRTDAEAEAFAGVFLDRLSYFLSNAKSPSDASFPAVLEL